MQWVRVTAGKGAKVGNRGSTMFNGRMAQRGRAKGKQGRKRARGNGNGQVTGVKVRG